MTNGSGSRRPKNMWIRIRNTDSSLKFLWFSVVGHIRGRMDLDPIRWLLRNSIRNAKAEKFFKSGKY
jgi:hypothetical protein